MKNPLTPDTGLARQVVYAAALGLIAVRFVAPETLCVVLSAVQTAVAVEVLRLMPR